MKRYTAPQGSAQRFARTCKSRVFEEALVSINISWLFPGHGAGILQVGLEREDRQPFPCNQSAEGWWLVCGCTEDSLRSSLEAL